MDIDASIIYNSYNTVLEFSMIQLLGGYLNKLLIVQKNI